MLIVEFQGVELDFCPVCRGAWFDRGELELIVELAGLTRQTVADALHTAAAAETSGRRRCPRCRRKMAVAAVGRERSVSIDRCPVGDGIWFDRGELAAFIRALTATPAAGLADFLGDLFRNELAGSTEERSR